MRLLVLCLAILSVRPSPATGESRWIDVPFISQQGYDCGAAAISMVLQYWAGHGFPVPASRSDVTQIMRESYSPAAKGIYASDMVAYMSKSGMQAIAFRGTLELLQQHVSRGRPLIVCLVIGSDAGPHHYVVVAGYDTGEDCLLVNDPASKKLGKIATEDFRHQWLATNNWCLLAVPGKKQRPSHAP